MGRFPHLHQQLIRIFFSYQSLFDLFISKAINTLLSQKVLSMQDLPDMSTQEQIYPIEQPLLTLGLRKLSRTTHLFTQLFCYTFSRVPLRIHANFRIVFTHPTAFLLLVHPLEEFMELCNLD